MKKYILKVLGKTMGAIEGRTFLDAIVRDMEQNGVSEKEALEREIKFESISANSY